MKNYTFLILTQLVFLTSFSQTNRLIDYSSWPAATVGGYINGDSVSKQAFSSQAGIGIYFKKEKKPVTIEGEQSTYKYSVTSFQITIIRNGTTIFSDSNNGNSFNTKIKDTLNSLNSEDIIVLSGIKAVKGKLKDKFYQVEFGLKPLLYIIK